MPQGRTRLTTPPGEEPAPAGRDAPDVEHYLPALDLPAEPHHPSRFRWLYVILTVLIVTVAIAFGVLQVTSGSRTFDPSLQFPGQGPAPAPTDGG